MDSGAEGAKLYVLRSLLDHSLRNLIRSKEQEHSQALLMIILPLIVLAGGKLSEGIPRRSKIQQCPSCFILVDVSLGLGVHCIRSLEALQTLQGICRFRQQHCISFCQLKLSANQQCHCLMEICTVNTAVCYTALQEMELIMMKLSLSFPPLQSTSSLHRGAEHFIRQ